MALLHPACGPGERSRRPQNRCGHRRRLPDGHLRRGCEKGTYNADFYIWFAWSGRVNPRNFEVVNGHLTFKHKESSAGRRRGICLLPLQGCSSRIFRSVGLSLGQTDAVDPDRGRGSRYAGISYTSPIIKNSTVNPGLNIGHRSTGNFLISASEFLYDTNFGHPGRLEHDGARYSRILVELPADHKGARIFVKTFLALFISVALAFLTFLIRPCRPPPSLQHGDIGHVRRGGIIAAGRHLERARRLPVSHLRGENPLCRDGFYLSLGA